MRCARGQVCAEIVALSRRRRAAARRVDPSALADAHYIIGWILVHAGDHTRGYATWLDGAAAVTPPSGAPPPLSCRVTFGSEP
jgi:hypothetical protein